CLHQRAGTRAGPHLVDVPALPRSAGGPRDRTESRHADGFGAHRLPDGGAREPVRHHGGAVGQRPRTSNRSLRMNPITPTMHYEDRVVTAFTFASVGRAL